jgi:hypothetical protein
MRSKAVAIHASMLVLMIALFLFIALVIFFGWINFQSVETTRASCTIKRFNFCVEWSKTDYKKEPDWNKPPKDCENNPINIGKPSMDQCKDLLQQSKY